MLIQVETGRCADGAAEVPLVSLWVLQSALSLRLLQSATAYPRRKSKNTETSLKKNILKLFFFFLSFVRKKTRLVHCLGKRTVKYGVRVCIICLQFHKIREYVQCLSLEYLSFLQIARPALRVL